MTGRASLLDARDEMRWPPAPLDPVLLSMLSLDEAERRVSAFAEAMDDYLAWATEYVKRHGPEALRGR